MTWFLIELIDELTSTGLMAAWPTLRESLSLDYTRIGLLLSLPAIAAGFIEPAIGLYIDRRPDRIRATILTGGILFCLALVAISGATGFWSALGALILWYPASGAFVSVAQLAMVDAAPSSESAKRRMLLWQIAGVIGALAGPLLIAGVLAVGGDWRWFGLGSAVLTMIAVVGFAIASSPDGSPAAQPPPAETRDWASVWSALKEPDVIRAMGLLLASDLLLDVLISYLALAGVDLAGISDSMAAIYTAVFIGSMLFGSAAAMRWAHLGNRKLVGWTALASTVLYPLVLLALVRGPEWTHLAGIAVLGVLVAPWYPLLKLELFDSLDERKSLALVIGPLVGMVLGLAPLVLGVVAAWTSPVVALALLEIGPIALWLAHRRTEGMGAQSQG